MAVLLEYKSCYSPELLAGDVCHLGQGTIKCSKSLPTGRPYPTNILVIGRIAPKNHIIRRPPPFSSGNHAIPYD
jgi:hypothetical protein